MKRVVSGLWGVAGVAALGAATLLPAGSADAALLMDFRFQDGSKTKVAAPGTYAVDVWAQVSGGTSGSNVNEGFLFAYGSIQSQQLNGGALTGGGVTDNTGVSPFVAAPPGQKGTAQNATADGVQDWGTTATNSTTTIKYQSVIDNGVDPVGTVPAYKTSSPTPVFNDLGPDAIEFKVGTFTVTIGANDVNSALGGETRFNWVRATGAFPNPTNHRVDGVNSTVYTAPTAANAISFTSVVPEPTTLGVLGVAGLGLLARRRRQAL